MEELKVTEQEKQLEQKEQNQTSFLENNDGVGVVEIILILVVLVALILIFKDKLTEIVQRAMAALEKSMEGILS